MLGRRRRSLENSGSNNKQLACCQPGSESLSTVEFMFQRGDLRLFL